MDHLGGSIGHDANTWMPDVWGYVAVKFGVKMVIDVGCGHGHACKWFADLGISVVGIDGDPDCVTNTVCKNVPASSRIVLHDFTSGPYVHGTPFDLTWSTEFLEHLEEKYLNNVQPCFAAAKYALITHGEPYQTGQHHVNCKSDRYWQTVFFQWGFEYVAEETELLRNTDRFRAPWGRRSLMFFRRVS